MEYHEIRGVTMCAVKATLAAGTTTTYSTTGATVYSIDGKAYSVAAKTNAATPTTDVNTGSAFTAITASKASLFVFGYNAAGTIKVAQGEIVDITGEADGADASILEAPEFPVLPEDFCPFGYLVTKVGASGSDWTFGSSNLAATSNVDHNFTDVFTLPTRPATS